MYRKSTFKGGIHPPHNKHLTEALPTEILPPPEKVIIPLSQHIGAPAKITVKRGDPVKIGQPIGESGGFVSSPVHASVSGKVSSISEFPHPLGRRVTGIEIENDGKDDTFDLQPLNKDWREAAHGEIIQKIMESGIVGMGGASFPTHVKLSPPADKQIDTLIINGAECEPYLTADYRIILEKTEEVLVGSLILKKTLGAKRAFIAIEDNKPDAISAVSEKLKNREFENLSIARLKTKYPQGGEKQLINAVIKREVPSGGLPMDVKCVVQNVGTAYAVWDAIQNGKPLYQRIVTVTGPVVKNPKNLLVRVGTPIRHVLEYCNTSLSDAQKVIMGGPMMGITLSDLEAPVIKSTSGLLVLSDITAGTRDYSCISCGNCVKACPIHLVPSILAKLVEKEKIPEADRWNVLDCMECGSCSYVCPSKINLVHFMKLGKYLVTAARKASETAKDR